MGIIKPEYSGREEDDGAGWEQQQNIEEHQQWIDEYGE